MKGNIGSIDRLIRRISMKIAIPSENGILSPHFGHCESFYIATVENGKIIESEFLIPPAHGQGVFPK